MKRLLKKLKFKPFHLAVLALFVFLLLSIPQTAEAACFSLTGGMNLGECVGGVFRFVGYVFNFLGVILFTLAGMLANLMLNLNLSVLSDSNSLVHIGWQIVRDIANLGFVLVIIVIAFATILRFEQYGVSKLLPKLIAAAIIVNFSFVIGAVFINFSNVLTNFFAARALPEPTPGSASGWDLSSSLADAFGPQRFFIDTNPQPPTGDEAGGLTEFGTAVLTSIADLIFIIVFTLIGAVVIFALAFMLFIRYLYLTFLMILAPLIWLFWVIPALEGQFKKWWDKFLQWVFFAPASMFFVYLALVSVKTLGSANLTFLNSSNAFTGIIKNTMIQGAQMVVLAGILIGGLIIAQKMGITGAKAALGAAKGVYGGVGKWAAYKTGFKRPEGAPPGWLSKQADKAATGLERFGNWKPQSRFARYASAPLRAPFQAVASGLAGGIKSFTKTEEQLKKEPLTLLGSMIRGAKDGSGLWKKKGRKGKVTLPSGEEVDVTLPEEEPGAGGAASAPGRPQQPPPPSPLAGVGEGTEEGERQINV